MVKEARSAKAAGRGRRTAGRRAGPGGPRVEMDREDELAAYLAAHKGHPRTRGECVMAKDWRCLIGLHDWREVEMPDRDKCAECTRCGKRDWRRLLTRTTSQWRGGDPPPGN